MLQIRKTNPSTSLCEDAEGRETTALNSRALLGGLVLFFCLLHLPCLAEVKGAYHKPTIIEGKVTNRLTDTPLAGASITVFTLQKKVVASAISNVDGTYEIRKNLSGRYRIQVSAKGYKTAVLFARLSLNKTYVMNFRLKPLQPNSPPKINTLIPQNLSTFVIGDTITILLKAQDPDKDELEYRYLMDDAIMQDWKTSSSFSFRTGFQNRGRHTLKVEVRDNQGGSASQAADIYIFIAFPKPSA